MANLSGFKVAILIENGFEQVEMTQPRKALDEAGLTRASSRRGENVSEGGTSPIGVMTSLSTQAWTLAAPDTFDALMLAGGVINPDTLRMQPKALQFVKAFFEPGKPVVVICHGPWRRLSRPERRVEDESRRGRRSKPISGTRARKWVNEEVVIDGDLMSSRKPDDIPAFNGAMIDVFSRARATA